MREGAAQCPNSTWVWRWLVAGWLFSLASAGLAQTNLPTTPPLLTNFFQIWGQAGEAAQQSQHIRAEAVITFYDMDWTVAFGMCDGQFTYLPIATSKMSLQAGQRILLDGWVIPAREIFSWDKTQIKVLEESVPLAATPMTNLRTNASQINAHMVSVEGLIDQDRVVDARHLGLAVLVNGENTTVNVHLRTANQAAAFKLGDFVRLKGIYTPTFDRDGNVTIMTLWVDGAENVEKTGSIATDPRFAVPAIRVDQLEEVAGSQLTRVAGVVRGYEPGKWVTMWDETGEIKIQSAQTQPLSFGDRIEAIGYARRNSGFGIISIPPLIGWRTPMRWLLFPAPPPTPPSFWRRKFKVLARRRSNATRRSSFAPSSSGPKQPAPFYLRAGCQRLCARGQSEVR
jgi:hypothetical protein